MVDGWCAGELAAPDTQLRLEMNKHGYFYNKVCVSVSVCVCVCRVCVCVCACVCLCVCVCVCVCTTLQDTLLISIYH